jgi:methanesulfonate monooxygenase small subunit
VRAAFEELVYRLALRLDSGDYPGFLALCAPELRYTIAAYSPEIRKPMTWLDHDKAGLQNLFETLPRHHSDRAPLSRHVTVYTVDVESAEGAAVQEGAVQAAIVTALQVFRTQPDGGATELFAVGKLYDRARLVGGSAQLLSRRVQLDTRQLGIGSHIPL